MQNFQSYNYKLTLDDLSKISEIVRDITIIINGEYYDQETETVKQKKQKGEREK